MWGEFKKFAFKGNVMDMAVGVMIGGAFGKIVSSLVADLFMPLIGLLTNGLDFTALFIPLDGNSYASVEAAKEANAAVFAYGSFISTIIDFILIAVCVFIFVKLINKLKRAPAQEPVAKEARLCPYCKSEIHDEATRCPRCTAELDNMYYTDAGMPDDEH